MILWWVWAFILWLLFIEFSRMCCTEAAYCVLFVFVEIFHWVYILQNTDLSSLDQKLCCLSDFSLHTADSFQHILWWWSQKRSCLQMERTNWAFQNDPKSQMNWIKQQMLDVGQEQDGEWGGSFKHFLLSYWRRMWDHWQIKWTRHRLQCLSAEHRKAC